MVCMSLVLCLEVREWCVPFLLMVGMSFLHGVCLLGEIVVGVLSLGVVSLLDVTSLVANTSMGGMITTLCLSGATDHGLHFVVLVVFQGDVWVFHLGAIGWILLSPTLEQMSRH
jgi:hypothetical protein